MSESLDAFFDKAGKWKEHFAKLRRIFLSLDLEEEFKWGRACYSSEGKNIAVLQGFKDYCAVMFFKGSLMPDPDGILTKPTENTQAGRQLRFTDAKRISIMAEQIKKYILEAVRIEKEGLDVTFKKTDEYEMPEELTAAFEADPAYREAFNALTPGRRRGYLLHFSSAKQSATRAARIEKSREKIFDGLGPNEFPKEDRKMTKATDGTAEVLQKIAAMKGPYRKMGERLHALILTTFPDISPRVWYGMPGYAKSASSPVLCFFRADKYFTFGLTEKARFDFGAPHKMSPASWFFEEMTEETEKEIVEVLRKGVKV